jgi:hypothetical protein
MREICEQFVNMRGIIYPKWSRVEIKFDDSDTQNEINNNGGLKKRKRKPKYKWIIEKNVYSYSKHFKNPKFVRLKISDKEKREKNLNTHIQSCSFRKCRLLIEKFKIYPIA